MKRYLLACLAFAAVALFSGCANYSTARHHLTNTVALALTVNGAEQPTPEQWNAIYVALEPQLAALGWVLVTDITQAERLIRIDFTPNPLDPQNSGRATVLSMTLNPRGPSALALARTRPVMSPAWTFASYRDETPFSGYDRYDRWSDGSYTYTPPTPPPSHHHRPGQPGNNNRDDCPPGSDRPPGHADNGNRRSPPPQDHGSWRDRTPTPSYSSPSYSSSSDYSSSSSSNSSSSSSFSSSSSSDYSSSSSSSSYSGSSGTHDTPSRSQN